jgi:hypothetical protein
LWDQHFENVVDTFGFWFRRTAIRPRQRNQDATVTAFAVLAIIAPNQQGGNRKMSGAEVGSSANRGTPGLPLDILRHFGNLRPE